MIYFVINKKYFTASIACVLILISYNKLHPMNTENYTETDLQNTLTMLQTGNITVGNIRAINSATISNCAFKDNSMVLPQRYNANAAGVIFNGQNNTVATNHPVQINGITVTNPRNITWTPAPS